MTDLLLDDIGMMMLEQLDAACGDLEAIIDQGRREEEETIIVTGDNGPVGSFTLAPTDVLERYTDMMELAGNLFHHILLLHQHRDIVIDRAMSWHISIDDSFIGSMQSIPSWDTVLKRLFIDGLVPLYRTFKTQQGDVP